MDTGPIKKRLQNIRHTMRKQDIKLLLLTDTANITYVTGFTGHDSWALLTNRSCCLLTDSRYSEQATSECKACKIVERSGPMHTAISAVLKKNNNHDKLAVEKTITLSTFESLRKNLPIKIVTAGDIVEPFRMLKDDAEVQTIRDAAKIAAKALLAIQKYFAAGITEGVLAGRLDLEMRKRGVSPSFDTIVAFGPNASRPHHQPGKTKLKSSDTILIDFGAKINGYCCDITRCFTIGRTTALYLKAYQAVKDAQKVAISMIRPGIVGAEVDAAARKVIESYDLPAFGHGLGHGLGLEVHEKPTMSANSKDILEAGNIITVEPGIYLPGKFGIRIEDDILITDNGCEVLTKQLKK